MRGPTLAFLRRSHDPSEASIALQPGESVLGDMESATMSVTLTTARAVFRPFEPEAHGDGTGTWALQSVSLWFDTAGANLIAWTASDEGCALLTRDSTLRWYPIEGDARAWRMRDDWMGAPDHIDLAVEGRYVFMGPLDEHGSLAYGPLDAFDAYHIMLFGTGHEPIDASFRRDRSVLLYGSAAGSTFRVQAGTGNALPTITDCADVAGNCGANAAQPSAVPAHRMP